MQQCNGDPGEAGGADHYVIVNVAQDDNGPTRSGASSPASPAPYCVAIGAQAVTVQSSSYPIKTISCVDVPPEKPPLFATTTTSFEVDLSSIEAYWLHRPVPES